MALKRPYYGHPAQMPWKATPITGVILALSALIAVASDTGSNREIVLALLIVGPEGAGQPFYRWISPVFLHFSWTHIIFNGLWLFAVGRLIEWRSRYVFLGLFVVTGLAGNVLQWAIQGPLFGGLSSVVYGLIGYVAIWDRLRRDKYDVPPAYLGLALLFLAIGFTGLDRMIGISFANYAHLGGLIGGVVFAAIHSQIGRIRGPKSID